MIKAMSQDEAFTLNSQLEIIGEKISKASTIIGLLQAHYLTLPDDLAKIYITQELDSFRNLLSIALDLLQDADHFTSAIIE